MKILAVHNRYQQAGGEDSVFRNEIELLRSGGHDVAVLEENNDRIKGTAAQIAAAAHAVWSRYGQRRMAEAIIRERPDVVHVHNFFPTLSPAIFWTCGEHRVPAVWTLHNFRVACANGLLFRDGQVCEKCLGASPLPAIRHGCYRGSRAASAAVAAMIATHRTMGTWRYKVDRFIALTDFARDKVIAAGLPADRVVVKPNFVDIARSETISDRSGTVFVGRLSAEKGVQVAVEAWRQMPHLKLTVIGDGPLRAELETNAPPNIEFTGALPSSDVYQRVAMAQAMVVPSVSYENFPMTVVEAMALGTPVIASNTGALAAIVGDGMSGALFEVGNHHDLTAKVSDLFMRPERLSVMSQNARERYEHQMSPQKNLHQLEQIYSEVIS
tara:strand:+ start:13869 stop:15020 length:1152 start_codon:yes stop_codon:yes gene_type:complete